MSDSAPLGPAARRPAANWPATAALVCGILSGALITLLGGSSGLPGTPASSGPPTQAAARTRNTALTAYNQVAHDVSDGRTRARLARDLSTAIASISSATADSRSAAATQPLAALTGDLRTMRADVQADRVGPRGLLLSLNRETRAADAACGTVHL